MTMIDGRIRLIAKEDVQGVPGFAYAPHNRSALAWDGRKGRFRRRWGRVVPWLIGLALCWGFWALVYAVARHVFS